jgi:acyl-CoA synthetase (AMP-forming)/AMP-acid ligase II
VVFRDELPTNATGKVLRRELVDEVTADARSAKFTADARSEKDTADARSAKF